MIYFYLISLVVFVIDQLIKWAVVSNMNIGGSITIVEGIISLSSHRNKGAAFGILQNQMWFLIIFTVVAVVFIIYYLHKAFRTSMLFALGLSLLLGGALGNFSDRIIRGEVVDMIEITFIKYPIFNMADTFIVCGSVLLFLGSWSRIKKGEH